MGVPADSSIHFDGLDGEQRTQSERKPLKRAYVSGARRLGSPWRPSSSGQSADRGVGYAVAPGNIGLRFASIEPR
jgi:hypothetical protein